RLGEDAACPDLHDPGVGAASARYEPWMRHASLDQAAGGPRPLGAEMHARDHAREAGREAYQRHGVGRNRTPVDPTCILVVGGAGHLLEGFADELLFGMRPGNVATMIEPAVD